MASFSAASRRRACTSCRCARARRDAAALMCSGVGKSGSPTLSTMMSRPCSRSRCARAVMLTVADGRMRCNRCASSIVKRETFSWAGARYLKMQCLGAPTERRSSDDRSNATTRREFRAGRRSAAGDRAARRRAHERAREADAARRHGIGQDVLHGLRHQRRAAADADPRAQQDARGAALRRDARVLPAQRRRVLRVVLRLLPARGLRPVERHVHREGRVDQQPHRADAVVGDESAARAARRRHRRDGVGDLRPRRPRGVPRHGAASRARLAAQPARLAAPLDGAAVRAQSARSRARHLSRARRRHRHLSGRVGEGRRARRAVRRRDRADQLLRSADGRGHAAHAARDDLSEDALRDAARDVARVRRPDPRRSRPSSSSGCAARTSSSRRSGSSSARGSTWR